MEIKNEITTGIFVPSPYDKILVNLEKIIGEFDSNASRKCFINSIEFFLECNDKKSLDKLEVLFSRKEKYCLMGITETEGVWKLWVKRKLKPHQINRAIISIKKIAGKFDCLLSLSACIWIFLPTEKYPV